MVLRKLPPHPLFTLNPPHPSSSPSFVLSKPFSSHLLLPPSPSSHISRVQMEAAKGNIESVSPSLPLSFSLFLSISLSIYLSISISLSLSLPI